MSPSTTPLVWCRLVGRSKCPRLFTLTYLNHPLIWGRSILVVPSAAVGHRPVCRLRPATDVGIKFHGPQIIGCVDINVAAESDAD